MLKCKLLLATSVLALSASGALAVCPQIPLNIHDSTGTNVVPMSSATAADGNCKVYQDYDANSLAHMDAIAPFPPGLAPIGYLGSFDAAMPVVPTIQNAAYVAGNAVGSLQTIQTFRNTTQPSGVLTAISLFFKGTESTPMTFYVFDQNPTSSTCTDKTAFVLNAADVPKLAFAPFTLTPTPPPAGTSATSATSTFSPISVHNNDGATTTNMYVCVVSGGSFTPALLDMSYKISIAQD